MPAKYFHIDGEAVHFLHTGATTLPGVPPALDRGTLFLFVHGAGRNAGDFRRALALLEAAHSGVALDLPGHGRSTGLEALPSIAMYANVVERLGSWLTRRPFVLVGWSMGALVALAAAERCPRAAGLVLLAGSGAGAIGDATLAAVHDVVRGRRPQIFDKTLFSPATPIEVMREAWMEQVKTDPRVLYGDLLVQRRFDARPLLPQVRLPTLVIHGADDRITPVVQAQELAAAIPGARFAVVERAGHIPQLEQPERAHELLVSFAEGLG